MNIWHFGENENIDIGKSRRLYKEGNARINTVYAIRPGLAKIIEKVPISSNFESPESDPHIAENAYNIDYADTWSLKQVLGSHKRRVQFTVLPIMDVKTWWNLTLESLE